MKKPTVSVDLHEYCRKTHEPVSTLAIRWYFRWFSVIRCSYIPTRNWGLWIAKIAVIGFFVVVTFCVWCLISSSSHFSVLKMQRLTIHRWLFAVGCWRVHQKQQRLSNILVAVWSTYNKLQTLSFWTQLFQENSFRSDWYNDTLAQNRWGLRYQVVRPREDTTVLKTACDTI